MRIADVPDDSQLYQAVEYQLNIHETDLKDVDDVEIFLLGSGVAGIAISATSWATVIEAKSRFKGHFEKCHAATFDRPPSGMEATIALEAIRRVKHDVATTLVEYEPTRPHEATLLSLLSAHGGLPRRDIAVQLDLTPQEVDKLLDKLKTEGLVSGSVESIVTLTEVGAAQLQRTKGGRGAIMAALMTHGPLSMRDLAAYMDRTIYTAKSSVRLLVKEGMIESISLDPNRADGKTYRRRKLFDLTEKGRRVGYRYVPPPRFPRATWNQPNQNRARVMRALVDANALVRADELAYAASISVRAVNQFLQEAGAEGYVVRTKVSHSPLTFGYILTNKGREIAEAYLKVHSEHTADAVYDTSDCVAYSVTVPANSPEIEDLIKKLASYKDVQVELLRAR